jgi:hypothetical protein
MDGVSVEEFDTWPVVGRIRAPSMTEMAGLTREALACRQLMKPYLEDDDGEADYSPA